MTHHTPPSGGSTPPPDDQQRREDDEPQLRGPLAPRPPGWEPPPRRTLEQRDDAIRARLGKIGGPLAFAGLVLWKVGRWVLLLLGKVALLFKIPLLGTVISGAVSIAAYAWIWGWTFAAAIMVTLLVHELGHVIQIRREGMPVKALNFVPFLGAYVLSDAARTADQQSRISIAGPLTGALLASAVYLAAGDDQLLRAIAFTGFYLNLLNLLPIGFLDGGGVASVFTGGWWALITVGMIGIGVTSGSMLAVIIGIVAAVRWWSHRDEGLALDRTDGVAYEARVNAAVLFLCVSAVCAFGMAAAFADRTDEIVRAPQAPPAAASAAPPAAHAPCHVPCRVL
ncbi:MAG: site-2 protease family protein [Patulibacter sp.]